MVRFLKWQQLYMFLSVALSVISIAALSIFQFEYSVEFTGGTNILYEVSQKPEEDTLSQLLDEIGIDNTEATVDANVLTIRTTTISPERQDQVFQHVQQIIDENATLLRSETVGPSVSQDLIVKTIIASGIAIAGILLYIFLTFKRWSFALGIILALLHDVLIVAGSYSILSYFFNAQFDTLFVTAILTTMSFSVHDTIVMLDQFRSYLNKYPSETNMSYFADRAISDTFMRSLNNSLTIVFMLTVLALIGGDTVRYFVITLLIGTILGTYSSPFVSIPFTVWYEKRQQRSNNNS